MSEWTKGGFGVWVHKSGARIEKTTNPHALRVWYVCPSSGGTVGAAAFSAGAGGGGFFKLGAAKAAVERAAAAGPK